MDAHARAGSGYMLGLLLAIYTVGFIDRQVINIVAEAVRRDMALSNLQLGLLTGFGFTTLYTVLALPAAALADRQDRRRVIAGAVGLWSFFTLLCASAAGFWQLLLYRIGVVVGEAGCVAPSHALISDRFEDARRPRALAVYSLGVPLGTLLGLAIGGIVADSFGWRMAFVVAGVPGIMLALLAWVTLPRRDGPHLAAARASPRALAARLLAFIRVPRTGWTTLGASAAVFVGAGQLAFYASFYLETAAEALARNGASFGLGAQGMLGLALGGIFGVGGMVGTLLGGYLCDRWGTNNRALVPMAAAACLLPATLLTFLPGPLGLSLLGLVATAILVNLWFGPVFAIVQAEALPGDRAMGSACLLFFVNMIGFGAGPFVLGLTADILASAHGFGQGDALRLAAIGCAAIASPIAMFGYWRARHTPARAGPA